MSTSTNHYIYHAHIADGFVDDCDELMRRCSKVDVLSYTKFCEIWKSMRFATAFHGRPSHSEIAELTEEMVLIAKHYMVANTSNFEELVAGLFLVYALLNLQPYRGFASLRVVPEDVPVINRIELVARRERRYDVLYILGSLLIKGPIQYHAVQRERGLESAYRKYLDGCTGLDVSGVRPKGVFYRQNVELDLLRELNGLSQEYELKKDIVSGKNDKRSLTYTDPELACALESSLKQAITGFAPEISTPSSTSKSPQQLIEQTREDTVSSIKQRAMMEKVLPVKHLTAVSDRQTKASNFLTKTQENKSKAVKLLKMTSPTKPSKERDRYFPASPRKRAATTQIDNNLSPKKSKNKHQQEQVNQVFVTSEESAELNLKKFLQSGISESFQVTVDSLPILIKGPNNSEYVEIEFIDQQVNNDEVIIPDNSVSEPVQLPDVTITKVAPKPNCTKTWKRKPNGLKWTVTNQEIPVTISKMAVTSPESMVISPKRTVTSLKSTVTSPKGTASSKNTVVTSTVTCPESRVSSLNNSVNCQISTETIPETTATMPESINSQINIEIVANRTATAPENITTNLISSPKTKASGSTSSTNSHSANSPKSLPINPKSPAISSKSLIKSPKNTATIPTCTGNSPQRITRSSVRTSSESSVTTEDDNFKRPPQISERLKKADRRQLKQPTLKRKLKKLGHLPAVEYDP